MRIHGAAWLTPEPPCVMRPSIANTPVPNCLCDGFCTVWANANGCTARLSGASGHGARFAQKGNPAWLFPALPWLSLQFRAPISSAEVVAQPARAAMHDA